jgi:hypothetical protein
LRVIDKFDISLSRWNNRKIDQALSLERRYDGKGIIPSQNGLLMAERIPDRQRPRLWI